MPWRKRAYITFTDKRKKYPISGRAKLLPRGKQNNIPSGSTISRYGNTRRQRHSNLSHATRSEYKRYTNDLTAKTDWGFAALKKCYGVTYVLHGSIFCTVHAHCNWISNRGIVPAPNCVWKTLLSSRVQTSLSTSKCRPHFSSFSTQQRFEFRDFNSNYASPSSYYTGRPLRELVNFELRAIFREPQCNWSPPTTL